MIRKKQPIPLQRELSEKRREYFEEVYRTYFDRLFAYALVITKSDSLSKDVVSEVFFNLWKAQTDLFSIKELKSYLFTSVKHQAVRTLSNDPEGFHIESFEQATSFIDKVNPEDLLVGKELDQIVNRVVEKLPPQCALIFKMTKEENKTYQEVAQELGISNDTVKYHVKTALRKIRTELGDHFPDTKVIKWISTGSIVLLISALLYSF